MLRAFKSFEYTPYAELFFFFNLLVSSCIFAFVSYETVLPDIAWMALVPSSILVSLVFCFPSFFSFRKSRLETFFLICGLVFLFFIILSRNFSALSLLFLLFLFLGATKIKPYFDWVFIINCIFCCFLIWSIIATHLNLTDWGWLPGQTTRNLHDGLWFRVSLLPYVNPAFSGLLCLLFLSINIFGTTSKNSNMAKFVILASLYFVVFSANRTSYLIFSNLLLILFMNKMKFSNLTMSLAIFFSVIFAFLFILFGTFLIYIIPVDFSFFVRSNEIEEGSVRTFMILEHLKMFLSAPLAGVGESGYKYDGPGGSEIQFFKSLALYGIFGVIYYLPFIAMLFSRFLMHKAVGLIFLFSSAFYSSFNLFYSVIVLLMIVSIMLARKPNVNKASFKF